MMHDARVFQEFNFNVNITRIMTLQGSIEGIKAHRAAACHYNFRIKKRKEKRNPI